MTNQLSPQRQRQVFWGTCAVGVFVSLVADQGTKAYAEAVHLLAPPFPSMADHRASTELFFALGPLPDGGAAGAHSSFLSVQITHVANAGVMLGALEEAARPIPPARVHGLNSPRPTAHRMDALKVPSPPTRGLRIGALTIATGVVGNLVDRLRLGYVVDWLYLKWRLGFWAVDAPAFNFADLLILGGACLAIGALCLRRCSTILARTRARGRPA